MLIRMSFIFVQLGFVKRQCEADSRWLPPNFGDCVSGDYQSLYDKVNEGIIFFFDETTTQQYNIAFT